MPTAQEILNSEMATENYAVHLSQNPTDFFYVLDKNQELGISYINRFTDQQIQTLIQTSYNPGRGKKPIAFFSELKKKLVRYSPADDRSDFYYFKRRVREGRIVYDSALEREAPTYDDRPNNLSLIRKMLAKGVLLVTRSQIGEYSYRYQDKQGNVSAPFFWAMRQVQPKLGFFDLEGDTFNPHPYLKSQGRELDDGIFATVVEAFIVRQMEEEEARVLPVFRRLLGPLSAQGVDPEFNAPNGKSAMQDNLLTVLLDEKKYQIALEILPKISPNVTLTILLKEKSMLPNLIKDIPNSTRSLYHFFYILATEASAENRSKILSYISSQDWASLLKAENLNQLTVPTGLLLEVDNILLILLQNKYYARATEILQNWSPDKRLAEAKKPAILNVLMDNLPATQTLLQTITNSLSSSSSSSHTHDNVATAPPPLPQDSPFVQDPRLTAVAPPPVYSNNNNNSASSSSSSSGHNIDVALTPEPSAPPYQGTLASSSAVQSTFLFSYDKLENKALVDDVLRNLQEYKEGEQTQVTSSLFSSRTSYQDLSQAEQQQVNDIIDNLEKYQKGTYQKPPYNLGGLKNS